MSYVIEFDFIYTISRYVDESETEEKEIDFYVLVTGEFDGEGYFNFEFSLRKDACSPEINDILQLLDPDEYKELNNIAHDKTIDHITDCMSEWRNR